MLCKFQGRLNPVEALLLSVTEQVQVSGWAEKWINRGSPVSILQDLFCCNLTGRQSLSKRVNIPPKDGKWVEWGMKIAITSRNDSIKLSSNASISECTNPPTENVFCVKLLNSLNRQHTLLLQQHYPFLFFLTLIAEGAICLPQRLPCLGLCTALCHLWVRIFISPIIPENTETMSVLNPSPQQVIPVCNNLLHDFYLVFDPILIFPPWIFMTDIALI